MKTAENLKLKSGGGWIDIDEMKTRLFFPDRRRIIRLEGMIK